MNRRIAYIAGFVALVAFGAYAFSNFQSGLVAYVSFDEARLGRSTVQVAGGLAEGSSSYDNADQALLFGLVDEASGETMNVRYHGLKPANFEEAVSIVAIGRYDRATREFAADSLLVKCPSKYQGAEVEKQYGSTADAGADAGADDEEYTRYD